MSDAIRVVLPDGSARAVPPGTTARQLAETIDRIKAAKVNVLFAEKYFASKLSDTIRKETGVKMYSISHISSGPYTKTKFIEEMRENLATLAAAINDSSKGA